MIRSSSEFAEISRLSSHPKLSRLSKKIDEEILRREATILTGKGGLDIFEI